MECYLLPFGLTGHRSLPSGHYSLAPRLTLHAYESPSPRPAVSAGCRPSPAGYGLTQTAALERKEAPLSGTKETWVAPSDFGSALSWVSMA